MGPAMMKALSHPLRWRIIGALNALGSARAADLAAELHEPANLVSFHLRTLAEAGMVAEAPELARDARERVWRLTQPSFNTDHELLRNDASYQASTLATMDMITTEMRNALARATEADPAEERYVAQWGGVSLRLNHRQALALSRRLMGLIEEFQHDPVSAAANTEATDSRGEGNDDEPVIYTGLLALAPMHPEPAPE